MGFWGRQGENEGIDEELGKEGWLRESNWGSNGK